MKALIPFLKKEALEQLRTGRLLLLATLFVLFGIMNPAIARLTPWLLKTMSDSLAQSGMTVTEVTVTAMDSWVQFFKNMPMALIAFVLAEGSIFTKEYESGTLILSLTKGLRRSTVVIAKALTLLLLWTAGYWLCFGITWGYNGYFWDNSIARNLPLSVVCWWLFGVWVIGLTVLFSTLSVTGTGVLLWTGGTVLLSTLLGLLPKVREYVPTLLTDGNSLIFGTAGADGYTPAILLTSVTAAVCFIAAVPLFHKKPL